MTEKFLHIKKGGYVSKELMLAYLNGNLSDAESKRIAKLIEADPFLADAIDGLKLANQDTISKTLDSIYKDIDIIVGNKKAFTLSASFKKYAAAAMILVFFGLTFLIMNQLNNSAKQQTDIALSPENNNNTIINDSSDMGGGSVAEELNNATSTKSNQIVKKPDMQPAVDEISDDAIALSDAQKQVFENKAAPIINESAQEGMDVDLYLSVPQPESTAGNIVTNNKADNKAEKETTVIASKKDIKVDKEEKVIATETTSTPSYNYDDINIIADTFIFAEQMPEFPGGTNALYAYLSKNINYAQCANASGTIYAKFVVTTEGLVSDVIIVKGLNMSADAEVLRVLKLMPTWKPGKQNGKLVNVWTTIPVKLEIGE